MPRGSAGVRTTRAESLAGHAERRTTFRSTSDIVIEDLYTPADIAGLDEDRDLGRPGEFPFTRGVQPTMYRGRLWTMRQYAGFSTAADTNERFRYLLSQGQTGLSVAFDLPTQTGYDSDAPEAAGEVGRVGVPISTLDDMEILLADLPLGEVTTSMTINATAAILLAFYVAAADRRGIPRERLGGTVQNDILKEYIARGTWIHPARPHDAPGDRRVRVLHGGAAPLEHHSISGYHIGRPGPRRPGAGVHARRRHRLRGGAGRAVSTSTASQVVSRSSSRRGSELFEEVAKFRAARRMWARIMRDRFGAQDPRSMMCRFHTQTAGSSLTARSIDNNVVRTTVQALAAVLGGTQSLHTNSRDEALALPTREAARLALRTQQILAHESGVAETPDPLAGSYFVESLTDQLEAVAVGYIEEIDRMGGAIAAIEAGFQQRSIQEAAYQVQRRIESGDLVVVGVNRFQDEDGGASPPILRIDPAAEADQVARLRAFRERRDQAASAGALERLRVAAEGTDNLVPVIIDAVKAGATLGEVSDGLRATWGAHRELVTI